MILLTGATGFVGRQVIQSLALQATPLRFVLRESSQRPADLRETDEVIETPDLFHADQAWWTEALTGIDTVIHLAWYAEPGHYLTSPKNLDCLNGSIEMAKACIATGVRGVVAIGTCAEYDPRRAS